MNTSRILAVADAIENASIPGLGFNMNYLNAKFNNPEINAQLNQHNHEPCGSVACIAGWTCAVAGLHDDRFNKAGAWLGLKANEQADLFFAENHPAADPDGIVPLDEIPASQAVRTLRHLAATGTVDWTV